MQKHPSITRDRIRQWLEHDLREKLILTSQPVETELLIGDIDQPAEALAAKGWKPISPGESWGPTYQHGWYRVKGAVPESYHCPVLLYGRPEIHPAVAWHTSVPTVEGTFWVDGQMVGGMDFAHHWYRLNAGSEVNLLVQTYAHNKETTVHRAEKPRTPLPEDFAGFLVADLDDALLGLYYDAAFAFDLLNGIGENEPAYAKVLRALNDVCNVWATGRPRNLAAVRRTLMAAVESLAVKPSHTVTALGHAHLDTAWLWPIHVTKLKMLHTTAIQLELADRYPEYVFVHSQASQYEWLEKDHPKVLERIQKAVKKGQWEPVGSMWVEADCNLTGGESLVRQFLYGRRYFQDKLGVRTDDMWLPDVFGYSAALPQILNQFGIKYFLTQKLSWNQFNKIPHNTFYWQGIDGSKIWTHFPPADNYGSDCNPSDMVAAFKKHRDHGRSDRSIYLFGFGDGGGGPTEVHLERLRRSRTSGYTPKIEEKEKAIDFFAKAKEEATDLCTWVGELYFEYHRGTYTSQAANKAHNRYCEMLMRDAETLCTFSSGSYPRADLERLWKVVLLNQFHDIIPGSSVREVYEDSDKDYAELRAEAEALVKDRLVSAAKNLDTVSMNYPVAVYHQADRSTEVRLDWAESWTPTAALCGEEKLPVQAVDDIYGKGIIFARPQQAANVVTAVDLTTDSPNEQGRLKSSARKLENNDWVVKFDSQGNIVSIQTQDEDPVEYVAAGQLAGVFQILDDKPLFWDAWDTDAYAQEVVTELTKSESFEWVEKGPVRVAVERVIKYGASTIRQRISLGPTPGIRFDTWVDWHESQKMLKVAFPLNVHSDFASFDIQFGHVKRPTHRNTSWDVARFEVCCQKWFDLSEGGHGMAVMNQGKYGCDVLNNVARLTLLKSPKAPDPICDMGEHHFTYVLYPHFDGVKEGGVVEASYAFNAKAWAVPVPKVAGDFDVLPTALKCSNRNLVLETVKRAEDSDAIVARLYECHNTRGRAELELAAPVKKTYMAMLDETELRPLDVNGNKVSFEYHPFEILTIVIEV